MWVVRELTDADDGAWDQLVIGSAQGNAFLRSDWLRMLCDTDDELHALRLGCFDEQGRLVSGQAMTYQWMWGMPVAATFEFFYCGPLLAGPTGRGNPPAGEVIPLLANALSERLSYVEMETHPAFGDVRPLLYSGWDTRPIYTHIWRMADPERVWAEMNREKRREIKRGLEHFVFEMADDDATMNAFLALYRSLMRKFLWQPSLRWEAIFRDRFCWMRDRDGCRLYVARPVSDPSALAGAVAVLLSPEDDTAYLWRQGSDPAWAEQGLVPALYWYAAKDLAPVLHNANFGGSPQPSLSRFKDYLGAKPVLHFAVTRRNAPVRLALLERGLRAKDATYNLMVRMAGRRFQELIHRLRG
jgi:hypothetical protein